MTLLFVDILRDFSSNGEFLLPEYLIFVQIDVFMRIMLNSMGINSIGLVVGKTWNEGTKPWQLDSLWIDKELRPLHARSRD
jgi:hypothetical protein